MTEQTHLAQTWPSRLQLIRFAGDALELFAALLLWLVALAAPKIRYGAAVTTGYDMAGIALGTWFGVRFTITLLVRLVLPKNRSQQAHLLAALLAALAAGLALVYDQLNPGMGLAAFGILFFVLLLAVEIVAALRRRAAHRQGLTQ
ncbi:MAG: hypothetical protein R3E31_30470 [Chloroflexota bacterium]